MNVPLPGAVALVGWALLLGATSSCFASGGEPSLFDAARAGDCGAVGRRIAAGADVRQTDRSGWTALHLAAGSGRGEVARLLLKHGADPNAASVGGATPLHSAAAAPK